MKKGSSVKARPNQNPQGVLNEEPGGQFKTVREDTAGLAIADIVPFQMIPEYRDPTESLYPIVVQTQGLYKCIDGWDKINKAKENGDSVVRCSISIIENHSDIELAIRKVSIRTKPQGGRCSYPETLRNTNLLAQIIISATEDPIIYSHGGDRKGIGFTQNREDDLREILAERLGRRRTTINTYLNQSRHINHNAFDALIDADVGRSFFEEIRVNKRILIRNMEGKGDGVEEITEAVSLKIHDWLAEYLATGKVRTVFGQENNEEDSESPSDGEGNTENTDPSATAPTEALVFEHQTGGSAGDPLERPDEEQIKAEIQGIISSFTEILGQSPIEIETTLGILREKTSKCAEILQMLMDLKACQQALETDVEAA